MKQIKEGMKAEENVKLLAVLCFETCSITFLVWNQYTGFYLQHVNLLLSEFSFSKMSSKYHFSQQQKILALHSVAIF